MSNREFVTPPYALRSTPAPSKLPNCELHRELALLLWSHPEFARPVGDADPPSLSADAKQEMIAFIKAKLGIKPLIRRDLDYVGE